MNTITLSNSTHTITNSDIAAESFQIVESICSSNSIDFGSCEVSKISITVRSQDDFIGEVFDVSINDGTNTYTWKNYKVIEDTKTADKCYKDLVLCDALYDLVNADVSEWYNTLLPAASSTTTVKGMRDSLFQHFSITQETATLVNDSVVIEKTIDPEELSGITVLKSICQINGCFCRIGRNGKAKYITLGGAAYPITSYKSALYEDYQTDLVDKLQIRANKNDIGIVVGTGDNCYVIEDNFLLYGKGTSDMQEVANSLYSVISTVQYVPLTVNAPANFAVEPGQAILITLRNNTSITSYVFTRTMKGIQSIFDQYKSKGDKKLPSRVNGLSKSIVQLKGKTNELDRSIEETKATITDLEEGLTSQITQTANSLTSEITRATGEENRLNTLISQTDDRITLEVSRLQTEIDGDINTYNVDTIPTLENYPAWNFTYNIPCNNTVKLSETLKFEYKDEYYSKNARSSAFNESTLVTYRFMKGDDGVWYWREVADSEYAYVLQQVSEVKVQANQISATVTENKTYTDGRMDTMSSQITQNANSITTKVSKGSVVSEINQTAESVKISASKIDLVGMVSATEFTSKFATITDLSATNVAVSGKASVADLNATNLAVSGKASIDALDAVSARVGNLEVAGYITATDVNGNVTSISGSAITTGTISASRINVNALLANTSVESSTGYFKAIHVATIYDNGSLGLKPKWKYNSSLGWYLSGSQS